LVLRIGCAHLHCAAHFIKSIGMAYSCKIYQYNRIRKDGTAPVYLRVLLHRTQKLDIKLPDIRLSSAQLRGETAVHPDPKLTRDYNLLLQRAKSKANDIFISYRLAERQLTPELFMREWDNPDVRNDFIHFIRQETHALEGIHQPQTLTTYRTTAKHLAAFRSHINFLDLTADFPEQFDRYLQRKKMSKNSRNKQHKNVKKFIHLAIRKGVKITNPYIHFKLERAATERTFLTRNEVENLYSLYRKQELPDWLHEDLRKFLFACFTGPRFSDINQFTTDNLLGDTLIYVAQKTLRFHKTIRVPLSNTAKLFLQEQDGHLFKQTEMQTYNRNLKDIADYAGIKKTITSHVARHTFATLFLESGGRVETLKELLGHRKIETTMIYVHLTDKRKEKEIKMMDIKNPDQ